MRPSPTNHDRCKIDWLTQAFDPAAMTAAAPPTGIAARQPGKSCPSRKRSAAPTIAAKPKTDAKPATGARTENLPHETASRPPVASSHMRPKGRKKAAIGWAPIEAISIANDRTASKAIAAAADT